MQKYFLLFFLGVTTNTKLISQTCNNAPWVWIKGDSISIQKVIPSIQGIQGVPDINNRPSGRQFSMYATNSLQKNLWVYGGEGFLNESIYPAVETLSDLWKYDIQKNTWTWLKGDLKTSNVQPVFGTKGTAASANTPGAVSLGGFLAGDSGKLWLFGGGSVYFVPGLRTFNNLWMYDTLTNMWTWIHGSGNSSNDGVYVSKKQFTSTGIPGSRMNPFFWKDMQGNLWVYGGNRFPQAKYYNDVWQFNIKNKQWRWVAGDDPKTYGKLPPGIWGTKKQSDPFASPGARMGGSSAHWTDSLGNLWLFGGRGGATNNYYQDSIYNDLWKFDISTESWTWMSGDTLAFQYSSYGEKGKADVGNKPSSRYAAFTAYNNDTLYLYGGIGNTQVGENTYSNDVQGSAGALTDLWAYDVRKDQWTWMAGDTTSLITAVYSKPNEINNNSKPGSRVAGAAFVSDNMFHLIGGDVFYTDPFETSRLSNDIWKLDTRALRYVEFGAFTSSNISNKGVLKWTTTYEKGPIQFWVEKSNNNADFSPINLGWTNTGTGSVYNYVDASAFINTKRTYYRIKAENADHCPVYSKSDSIEVHYENVKIYPNPAHSVLYIQLTMSTATDVVLKIISFNGAVLKSMKFNAQTGLNIYAVNVDDLAAADYLLEVVQEGLTKNFTFMKY